MTVTTEPAATDAAPVAKRGFPNLKCFHCGAEGGTTLQLDDMTFVCTGCDAETSLEDVGRFLHSWQIVLGWAMLAPKYDE